MRPNWPSSAAAPADTPQPFWELIAEGALAIEMGATAEDVRSSIHPHPTLSETLMESAEVFFGHSTHVYRPKKAARPT